MAFQLFRSQPTRRRNRPPGLTVVSIDLVPVQYDSAERAIMIAIVRSGPPKATRKLTRPAVRIAHCLCPLDCPAAPYLCSLLCKSDWRRRHRLLGGYATLLPKVNILILENVHAPCCETPRRWPMSLVWRRHYAHHGISAKTYLHFPLKKNPVYSAIRSRVGDHAGIRHTRCRRGKHEAVEFEIAGERIVDHHVGITI